MQLRLVTQCRDQEAGLDSLRQLRTAAGKVTAKRAKVLRGARSSALTPRERSCARWSRHDDTSLEQLQERV